MTRRLMEGSEAITAWQICFKKVVLPVLGGATIRPRVPLPMGQSRSTARTVFSWDPPSRRIHWWGATGVLPSKGSLRWGGLKETLLIRVVVGAGFEPA